MVSKNYFGCYVSQREDSNTVPFFVFYARVKDIKQWTDVRRVHNSTEGTQRVLRETRMRAITRFIKSDPRNTIPNNILLAFEPERAKFTSLEKKLLDCTEVNLNNDCDQQVKWGLLNFSFDADKQDYPAFIVDGQHRLYGMSGFDLENLPVLAVSLLDASVEEQAFQFIVINNKAVRVPTDNVKAIIANLKEEELQSRLLKAGVKYGNASPTLKDINDLQTSPFRNLLDWPYNQEGKKLVPIAAIEQSLKYIKALFTFLDEDEDCLVEIFCSIWRAVQKNYTGI